jgi:hypothetical protein
MSVTGLLREEKRDQLPEAQVEHEDEADHDDQGGQHDRGVVESSAREGHATWRISSLTSRVNWTGVVRLRPEGARGAWVRGRCARPTLNPRARAGWPETHRPPSALGAASCAWFRDSRVVPHIMFGGSSWSSGLLGQGRRDSNPQPPVLETGALPVELLPSVGCLGFPSGKRFFPLTWGTASQSSTGRPGSLSGSPCAPCAGGPSGRTSSSRSARGR